MATVLSSDHAIYALRIQLRIQNEKTKLSDQNQSLTQNLIHLRSGTFKKLVK